jgi:hypothetical protein
MLIPTKNMWAAPGGIEAARTDLFAVLITLPPALGGDAAWQQDVQFAIEKFPFPDRARESIPIKYMQQTNYFPGADSTVNPIDFTVRWNFNRNTVKILETWYQAFSNPHTGAVGRATELKCNGRFFWLIPASGATLDAAGTPDNPTSNPYIAKETYWLEGCWPTNFKPSDADMTTGNTIVTCNLSMQIDRYYPKTIDNLTFEVVGPTQTGYLNISNTGATI